MPSLSRLSFTYLFCAQFALLAHIGVAEAQSSPTLTPGKPIALPGAGGGFDYMTIDPAYNRLYASHPGAKGLAVLDLGKMKAREIDLGAEVNGVAYDAPDNKFFTAGGGRKLFALDRKSLKQLDVVPLSDDGDGILFDPDNDSLYVDNDENTHVWVYNGKTDKLVSTITVGLAPEYMQYDPATKRIYHNIKRGNELQVIDTTTNAVTASWPTAPMTSPHGLVFDPSTNRLYSAGKNDLIDVMDASTGKVIATAPLASGVDQIAWDPKLRRIYCPGGGFMTIVSLATNGDVSGTTNLEIDKGAHTIAVDPKTSIVWICYDDSGKSYLQPFTPTPAQ